MAPASRKRIVVLGMMGRCPFGGQTWLYLNWLLGLRKLGHEVWYVEDDSVWPYDPVANRITGDCTYAVDHIARSMDRIGLGDRWAFRFTDASGWSDQSGACWGISSAELNALYASCDALLNVVGATTLREEHMAAPLRVYVECDPVIAELRFSADDPQTREAFASHDVLVTYGENYGAADCGVPIDGLNFLKTRQPIDLEYWRMEFDPAARYFTTIGNYRQSGFDVEYKGETYRWSKHHEWEKLIDLPSRTSQEFELAIKVDDPADRSLLQGHGWRVISPLEMSLDVFGAYPAYFGRSRAEFTVAKDQNVRLRSGWFSERDATYLACGKPVVAQETGFSNIFPTGEGLFGFSTAEEALAAIEAINVDYAGNCRAARAITEDYFRAERVAAKLLMDIGL